MIIPESFLKDIERFLIWFPLRWLANCLPPGKDFSIIRFLGRLYYYHDKKNIVPIIKNMKNNIDLARHPLSQKEIIFRTLETHFLNQYLVFFFKKFDKTNISKYHDFDGLENVEKALQRGKGCIIVHGHFGPAQLPLIHFGLKDYLVTQMGHHPIGNHLSSIGKLIQKKKIAMEMSGSTNIVMVGSFLRPIFQRLKNNGIVMVTGDGVGGRRFIGKYCPVSFLSKTVLFPRGPASLAQKTEAALLPAFTIPATGNRFRTIIEKPINIHSNSMVEIDIKKNTQAFATIMEAYVKKYPFHWHFWDEFEKGGMVV